ncbi:MAG: hypothetical protein FWD84_01840 [Oscillospiraceae bacterium]|nr:hypothetical protein [Oscillospiraceae bacterium]
MLTYFVIAPVLIAVCLYIFPSVRLRRVIVVLAQSALVAAALYLLTLTSGAREVVTNVGDYAGVLGITLRADRLSAVFVLLTAVLFLVVSIYNFSEQKSKLFWFLLFIWEGAFIGLFLTRDLFNIFVLVEVASVTTAVLLMYYRGNRSMYHGLAFLIIGVIVMQFYLLGIGYLYRLTGGFDMDYSARIIAQLDRAELILPYALIMTAIAAKCAVLPLFTFLPKICSIPLAPAPVAAILSGLQVKSGIYLFLRFREMFPDMDHMGFFLGVGILTAVFGVILALGQTDIKKMLAYSTMAQVGLILIGLHINSPYAYYGSLYHIITHAISKAALFLGAGVLAKVYGTRNIAEIRGVFRQMPWVGVATALAILSMIGAPLFGGNISKYFLMTDAPLPLYVLITLINLGTVVIFLRYAAMLFGHPRRALVVEGARVKVDANQRDGLMVLGVLCLLSGVFGPQLIRALFGIDVALSFWSYTEKVITLAASVAVGYLLLKYVGKAAALTSIHLDRLELGFRGICVSVGGFFAVMLIVMGFLG